jgi:lantibiotic transport system permease protein
MLAVLSTELIKLRRSLVLLVAAAAPACVTAFAAIALGARPIAVQWERFLDEGLAMWSFFMMPMSVTAVTALLAQLEHGSRMWNHLLVTPVRRPSLFAAKAAVAVAVVLLMQVLVYVGLYSAGLIVGAVVPEHRLSGDMQFGEMAIGMVAMVVGGLPMIFIQLWVALRWRSFVLPLVVGIIGTFFALVITASGVNVYIPWILQIYATMWPKPAGIVGVWGGLAGGTLALSLLVADLSRREPQCAS